MIKVIPQNLAAIPAPKGIPVAGNAFQIDKKRFHIQFEKWAKELGSIYKVNVFKKSIFVISDADAIQQVFKGRPEKFRRREIIEEVAEDMGINGVFTSEGLLWKQQRKLVNEAFKTANLRGFYPTIKKVNQPMISKLDEHHEKQEMIDIGHLIDRWALDISTLLMFNYELNSIQNQDTELYAYFNKVFPMFSSRIMPGAIPMWKHLKLSKDREIDKIMDNFRKIFIPIIEENRNRINSDETFDEIPTNLLEGMIRAKDDNGYTFNNDDVFANVFSLLLAGKDAVTLSTLWVIYFITQFPQTQLKIRQEIEKTVGDSTIKFEDIRKLKYLTAVISETLRLKAIAPMISSESMEETEIMGIKFPAGSIFLLLTRIDSFKDEHFSNALDFNPERWLDAQSAQNHCPMKSMPFGGGKRLCSGNQLAVVEIATVVAEICRRYTMTNDLNGKKADETYAFLMSPSAFKIKLSALS